MPVFRSYCANKVGVEKIAPFQWYNWHNGASCYTAVMDDQPIFIKSDSIYRLLRHETNMTQHFFSKQPDSCPDIIFSHFGRSFRFLGLKYIVGHNLNEVLQKKVKVNWPQFFSKLLTILDSLYELKMIHRDITPSNLMISTGIGKEAFSLVLIDFSFSLIPGGENIDSFLEKSCAMKLGRHLKPSPYIWDDAYSCHHIYKHIQLHTGRSFEKYSQEFEMRIGRLTHVFGQPVS